MHRKELGCRLTPDYVTCPGEENCILYQTYAKLFEK